MHVHVRCVCMRNTYMSLNWKAEDFDAGFGAAGTGDLDVQ